VSAAGNGSSTREAPATPVPEVLETRTIRG
jgi:hypothetical protein